MSLQDILNSAAYQSRIGYSYRAMKSGRVVFSANMTGKTIIARARTYDKSITVDSLPDKYLLPAVYWIMYRHYATTNDKRYQHYYALYQEEMRKISHNRLGSTAICIGDDL